MQEVTLFTEEKPLVETFKPRPYQQEAINTAIWFFKSSKPGVHGITVLPTGSGKSIVIANIAKDIEGRTIVFQPSKEILEQNYAKFISYGYRASIYSASIGQKRTSGVVFATIGSVASKHHLFREFKNIIIDECHLVNPKGGMYHDFIHSIEGCKCLGLTATPYRLSTGSDGAMLKFLTRVKPRIFSKVLYVVQNSVLFEAGYLAKLQYFSFNTIDRRMLQLNSTGTDYTESSVKAYYKKINFPQTTAYWASRLLAKRKNLLIFCATIEDSLKASHLIPGSVVLTGETEKRERERILHQFKTGKIKCLLNCGVLTTGFDYPELETVLIVRSTMSLSLYYQIVGRVMRIHPNKENAFVVDLGGNIDFFGKIETMKVVQGPTGLYSVVNNGKQLTNVNLQK